ncbi:MAG: GTP cyclohydrolase I FolE2 [Candidatus Coatesbacteria bacterium]|nr:MAG: GTP cyclohydrolase I FolE2 [Candidatus Coatesbacteria bacterium]
MSDNGGLNDIAFDRPEAAVPINQVGVRGLRMPVEVLDRAWGRQHTIATVDMFVDLPGQFRGTHMSRFVEILNVYRHNINYMSLAKVLRDMRARFDAKSAHVTVEFPYYVEKAAPVSGEKSPYEVKARFIGDLDGGYAFGLGVAVPVMNLCPCSKEISEAGAHNQRGDVYVEVMGRKLIWIEEIIDWVESASSAPLYALLKREDEKAVTELAYENPRFVEDVVRGVAAILDEEPRARAYKVECTNFESIHQHDAFARIERVK